MMRLFWVAFLLGTMATGGFAQESLTVQARKQAPPSHGGPRDPEDARRAGLSHPG